MNRIIAALDLGPASNTVADIAGTLAVAMGARLTLVHAQPIQTSSPEAPIVSIPIAEIQQTMETFADRLRRRLPGKLSVDVEVGMLPPASEILEYTNATDLIVIGQTERHGLWRFLLGDVTGRVIDGARCPVLVVPEGYPAAMPKELLFSLADRLPAGDTFAPLAALSRAAEARLQVYHILEDWGATHNDTLEELMGDLDWCYTLESEARDIGKQIVARAAEVEGSWLCILHRHRVPLAQLLQRSLSEKVAAISKRPVLILVE